MTIKLKCMTCNAIIDAEIIVRRKKCPECLISLDKRACFSKKLVEMVLTTSKDKASHAHAPTTCSALAPPVNTR